MSFPKTRSRQRQSSENNVVRSRELKWLRTEHWRDLLQHGRDLLRQRRDLLRQRRDLLQRSRQQV